MRQRLLLLLPVLWFPACDDSTPPPAKVEIEEAWFQLPVVGGHPGAAYFTLKTNSDGVRLKQVETDLAAKVELHGPGMRQLNDGDLTFQDRELRFAPGSKHAMLLDIQPNAIPCETSTLTLHFEGAPSISEPVLTRKIGDESCEEIYRSVTRGANDR